MESLHDRLKEVPVSGKADDLLREKEEICQLMRRSCQLLDQEKYDAWLELFAENCVYNVVTWENVQAGYAFDLIRAPDKPHLAEWIGIVTGFHQAERVKSLHLLSTPLIELSPENQEAQSWAGFALYRTGRDGVTQLHCVGEYRDVLRNIDSKWRIQRREVLLHTSTLPGTLQVI
jgi:3-phenylpropionate/cinnamic acid dioxygenase small subunit